MSKKVQSLIEAAKARNSKVPTLPAHALAALREVFEYNDAATTRKCDRVTKQQARDMLATDFGVSIGDDGLDAVCRAQLGRKGFHK